MKSYAVIQVTVKIQNSYLTAYQLPTCNGC